MSDFHYIDAPRSLGRAGRIIVWVVVLALLIGVSAAVVLVTDGYVRDAATGVVRDGVSTALGLGDDQDVEIDVGDGLLLTQALAGTVDEVTATVPDFAFDGGSASLVLRVSGIPIPPTGPVDEVTAQVRFTEEQLLAIQSSIAGAPLTGVEYIGGAVNVTSTVDLGGGTIVPLVIGLVPSVLDGTIVFTPSNVRVGETVDVAEAWLASPTGPLLAPLLAPRSFCAAALLPSALSVDAVEATDDALVISAAGVGVRLTGQDFNTNGSCAVA